MKKKRVVIPENMGRGIKANTEKSQYEVDLTDYVDGSTVTYTGGKLGVNVPASITSVSTAGAIEGDGSVTNPVKLDFNDSIVKGTDGKYGVAETGLTCASIDDLPEKPWKKGTTILAKQDGACVRLAVLDSIFQEIGVGITADKTNSFTNEEYKVVVTVSNTGEGKNELTNLNIVGPANTADYDIKDVTFTKSEADEVEQVNNLTYNIRGLNKGGTVKVKYTVVPKVLGNYQFTAAVNPNSALDKDLGNNNATLILNARIKSDPTYVPSVDCPLITATELDSNVVLQQLPTTMVEINRVVTPVQDMTTDTAYNIFTRLRTLRGLRIRLDGASTVVGYSKKGRNQYGIIFTDVSTASYRVESDISDLVAVNADATKLGSNGYTFNNGILEITGDFDVFAFSCRPQGENCKWQSYMLYATIPNKKDVITVTDVSGAETGVDQIYYDTESVYKLGNVLTIPAEDAVKLYSSRVTSLTERGNPQRTREILTVTVRAGTAASLKYTSTDNYAVTQVRGKTTITEDTITVAADAKATDSVNTRYIKVIIEE